MARCGSGDERGEETRWEFSSHLLPHPMGAVWGQKLQCNFGCGVLGWFFTPRHTSEKPKMLHGEVLPTDGLDKKGGDWQSRARTWLHPHVGGGDGDPHHGLVDGVRRLVREDAGGEAGDHLLHPALVGRVQDVVVDVDVSPLGTEREEFVSGILSRWSWRGNPKTRRSVGCRLQKPEQMFRL